MKKDIEIVSKEIIKPISPTPNHLRCFELSIFDKESPAAPVTLILYYPLPQELKHDKDATNNSRLQLLKNSLSHLLARFYPFAGRLKEDYTSIACNDDGVPFLEAFAHGYHLDEIIEQPCSNMKLLRHFVPYEDTISFSTIPLFVQVTFFECGGMSIGLSASHKITDGSTLSTLLKGWTSIATSNCDPKVSTTLEFVHTSKFLPQKLLDAYNLLQLESMPYMVPPEDNNIITNIFHFNASCISAVRASAASDTVPVPTRLETLSALIWKCVVVAVNHRSSIKGKPYSLLFRNVDLRRRHGIVLPIDCMGNAITAITTTLCTKKLEDEMELSDVVTSLRNNLSEFLDEYENEQGTISALMNAAIKIGAQVRRGDIDIYGFSSLCGFQFHDMNFGWGKPSWVSIPNSFQSKNNVLLMDTTRDGGGIEAWVTLEKADMVIFEQEIHKLLNGCEFKLL